MRISAASVIFLFAVACLGFGKVSRGQNKPVPGGNSDTQEARDAERDWQRANRHEGSCLDFESADAESEFRDKMTKLRKEFLDYLARKTDDRMLYVDGDAMLHLWLIAEYGNPGCLSGVAWQPNPSWPGGATKSVSLHVCDAVTIECGTWTFQGLEGTAQWKSGAESTLRVDPPKDEVIVIHRTDTSGPTAGLTGIYAGTLNHHIFVGDYKTTLKSETTKGVWQAWFEMN